MVEGLVGGVRTGTDTALAGLQNEPEYKAKI